MGGSGGHCGSGGGVEEVSNGFPCQEILFAVKIVKAYQFFRGGGGGGGVGSSGSGGLMVVAERESNDFPCQKKLKIEELRF